MSGINSLPGGGKDFSPHRFKRKFKYLSEKSKVVSPLSENQESIIKAVEKYQKFIRRGTFGKMQQKRAIRQIKSSENLGIVKLKKVKKIIHKLGEGHIDEVKESKPEIEDVIKPRIRIDRAGTEDLPGPRLARANTNRRLNLDRSAVNNDYNSAFTNRPLVSINQTKDLERGTGLAGSNKSNISKPSSPSTKSSRPSIPLLR